MKAMAAYLRCSQLCRACNVDPKSRAFCGSNIKEKNKVIITKKKLNIYTKKYIYSIKKL